MVIWYLLTGIWILLHLHFFAVLTRHARVLGSSDQRERPALHKDGFGTLQLIEIDTSNLAVSWVSLIEVRTLTVPIINLHTKHCIRGINFVPI